MRPLFDSGGAVGLDAVNDCVDNVMSTLEDELECEAFGGTGSRKKTVQDRRLVQEEKKKSVRRERRKRWRARRMR